jgi:hypothetical protein
VVTVPLEHAFQHENMSKVVLGALTDWPEKSERLNMADGKR